jgi:hypothetical protein
MEKPMNRQGLAEPAMSHHAPKRWFAPGRQHTVPAVFLLMMLLAACQGSGAGPASPSASPTGSPAHAARPAVPALASGCSDSSPCPIAAGTYRLGPATVLPGLEVTVPSGWSSTYNTPGELNLVPPGQPNDALKFWLDVAAVKSSGAGHGTTVLKHVGRTPSALTAWLTHNRDFLIVSKPAAATIGHGITMTSLVVGVSRSANYGDPGCPANPRCADLFTNSYFGSSDFYGIGGDEEARLYLGTIQIGGSAHTFVIALDAVNHADMLRLEEAANPIVNSARLPTGAGNG